MEDEAVDRLLIEVEQLFEGPRTAMLQAIEEVPVVASYAVRRKVQGHVVRESAGLSLAPLPTKAGTRLTTLDTGPLRNVPGFLRIREFVRHTGRALGADEPYYNLVVGLVHLEPR